MNKLKTDINGLMPIFLDDIRWMDAAVREAFYGLMSAIGITPDQSFKLSGCEVTQEDTTYTTTAGYIVLNGEILKVLSHSVTQQTGDTGIKGWYIYSSYDVSGNKSFKDGVSHDTYEIRVAKLGTDLNPETSHMPFDAPYLSDKLAELIGLNSLLSVINGVWTTHNFNASDFTTAVGSWTVSAAKLRSKIIGKTMILNIEITASVTESATGLYIKIPNGKKPPATGSTSKAVFYARYGDSPYTLMPMMASSMINGANGAISLIPLEGGTPPDTTSLEIYGQITFEIS